ncbi:MAG: UvrD-helicase domain-containing protein [Deltaproteobacteria bacterium]|nr:UvrD-helicase domain-containing protein [Deltaproteobacteria bacterium]
MSQPLEQALNPQQLAAVLDESHALCILAGAGSGKTRVITYRIYDMVRRRGIAPGSILAVTFTNKAAREMRERVDRLLPGAGRGLTVATFHSACARLLREHGAAVGLSPGFTIYDEEDSARLVEQLLGSRSEGRLEARAIYRRIEQARNDGLGPEAMVISEFDLPGRRARELLEPYAAALRRADGCDFAGLLLEVLRLLEAGAEPARAIAARFRHLLVDEYQDTNRVQARLVHILGRPADSVTVVGDDDQSIYAWRGACADNLMDFMRAFPSARLVRLEQNYRSTQTILEVANAVIAPNPGRIPKRLFTRGDRGASLRILGTPDDRAEAQTVADEVDRAVRAGVAPDQVAVLYRTNAQSRPIEEVLRRRRRPYRVVGGVRFYDRKEVKDLVAYLRLCVNPRSDVDLLRVLNTPARGIGDTTRGLLVDAGRAQRRPLFEVLADGERLAAAGLKTAALARVRAFVDLLRGLAEEVSGVPADAAAHLAAQRSGLLGALEQVAGPGLAGAEAADRLQNIGALVSAAHDFVAEARAGGQPDDVAAFLEAAALATDVESVSEEGPGSAPVTLMTLHAAKGLEFDAVVMCGLEEGLFPQARDGGLDDAERLAEERRLCYVGITRARRQLSLTYARARQTFGETHRCQRSRFLEDIPARLVERRQPPPAAPTAVRYGSRPPRATVPGRPDVVLDEIDMDFAADFVDDLRGCDFAGPEVGARVRHATFGRGQVTAREGSGPNGRLVIRFEGCGIKRVVAKYVTLVGSAEP